MPAAQTTTSKRLIYNTGFNMLTHVVTAAISFALIRFFLVELGESRYGIWVLVGSIFRYRMFMTMGLNSAINRYVPVYLAQQDDEGVARVTSTSFFFLLAVGGLLAVLTVVAHLNLGSWFEIQPEHLESAAALVLIVGFSFAIVMPLQIASALLSGIQRYDIINSVTLALIVSRTILLVLLMQRGYGLLTMGWLFGGSEVLIRLLQFGYARRLLPTAKISIRHIRLPLLKEMAGYGMNTILYTTGALILYKASDIMIGIYLGTDQISQFSIATAAVLLLAEFTQVFSSAVKPAVSDLDARSDDLRMNEISHLTQKYSLLMLIPASCFFVVMGGDFLSVWVGDNFSDSAVIDTMATIMAIFVVGHALRLAQHSNFVVLVGRGEHQMFGIFTLLTSALFVLISVICLGTLGMGLVAVAWANFAPVVLVSGVILPIYFNHKMQIPYRETLSRVWLPAALGTLPAVGVIIAWKSISAPDSWIQIAGVIAATGLVTGIGSWLFALDAGERNRFLKLVPRRR